MPREMKETGIEWIGKVPKDWDIVRLKYISDFYNGFSFDSNDLVSDYKYPVIRIGDIKSDYVNLESDLGVKDNSNLQSYLIKKDDILLAMSGATVGKVGYVESDRQAYINQRVGIIRSELSLFIFYNLLCKSFLDYILIRADGSAQPNISSKMIKEFIIALPKDVSKIKKIVNVIKSRLNIIDSLKETIESEIKTLDEYKKSIITEAVTKGLDKGAEMKDSGIEWIGQIPKHWKVHRISKYFYEGKDKNILGKETNLLSLSYGNIIRKDINTLTGLLPENFNTYNIVEKGDIIIRPTDLQNDKKSLRTGLVKERGIITSAYIDLKPYKFTLSKYFHYLLHSYDLMKVFYNMGSGVRQGLNYSEFAKLLVMEPPINEQKAIAEYLDHKISAINEAIDGKRAQLVALDEYKKSLIYEYVTGKKEA